MDWGLTRCAWGVVLCSGGHVGFAGVAVGKSRRVCEDGSKTNSNGNAPVLTFLVLVGRGMLVPAAGLARTRLLVSSNSPRDTSWLGACASSRVVVQAAAPDIAVYRTVCATRLLASQRGSLLRNDHVPCATNFQLICHVLRTVLHTLLEACLSSGKEVDARV